MYYIDKLLIKQLKRGIKMQEFTIYLDEFITINLSTRLYEMGESIILINDYPDRNETLQAFHEWGSNPYEETEALTDLIISKELTSVSSIVDFIIEYYQQDSEDNDCGFSLSELTPKLNRGLRQWNQF